MTVRETEYRVTGAEMLRVICSHPECHTAVGEKLLVNIHQGYASGVYDRITDDVIQKAEGIAHAHDKKHQGNHNVRVIVFRAEDHK